jgi:CheY-like chemotaxis protein
MQITMKVLIIEDEFLIADMLAETLDLNGMEVCGIAANRQEALEIAATSHPTCAIVDVRLQGGDLGTAVVRELLALEPMGILYATGNYDLILSDPKVQGHACFKKPYRAKDIVTGLQIIHDLRLTGYSRIPYPEAMIPLPSLYQLSP